MGRWVRPDDSDVEFGRSRKKDKAMKIAPHYRTGSQSKAGKAGVEQRILFYRGKADGRERQKRVTARRSAEGSERVGDPRLIINELPVL